MSIYDDADALAGKMLGEYMKRDNIKYIIDKYTIGGYSAKYIEIPPRNIYLYECPEILSKNTKFLEAYKRCKYITDCNHDFIIDYFYDMYEEIFKLMRIFKILFKFTHN